MDAAPTFPRVKFRCLRSQRETTYGTHLLEIGNRTVFSIWRPVFLICAAVPKNSPESTPQPCYSAASKRPRGCQQTFCVDP